MIETDLYMRARAERAKLMGEYLSRFWTWATSIFKGAPSSLEDCKTSADVIAYARSIQPSQPIFAAELVAAAYRANE